MTARWKRGGVWLFALGAGACGGKVVEGGDPDPTTTDPSNGEASGGDRPGAVDLPACKPGFAPGEQPARPCNFVVDGACFDTKEGACACACPRGKTSACVSDFPEEDGEVPVTCS